MGRWDDVIEEAAGELEGVEGQLHTASRQLLDLRSATAQLSADAQKASDAKEQACTPCFHYILARTHSLANPPKALFEQQTQASSAWDTSQVQCYYMQHTMSHTVGFCTARDPPVVSSKFNYISKSPGLQTQAREILQAEREAEQARERLREALAEASAARHDAARHRAAADAAEEGRREMDEKRERLRMDVDGLEGEVSRLNRQLEEAAGSCQAQVCRL